MSEALGVHVDPDDPALGEVFQSAGVLYSSNWRTTRFDPGHDNGRWAHVDTAAALEHLRRLHAINDPGETRSPTGAGCASCGVATSTSWRHIFVADDYRQACTACHHDMEAAGNTVGAEWRDRIACRAAGLTANHVAGLISVSQQAARGERIPGVSELIGFRLYIETGGGAGTPQPFEYLGDERQQLIDYAAGRWPEHIADPIARLAATQRAQDDALRRRHTRHEAPNLGSLRLPGGVQ